MNLETKLTPREIRETLTKKTVIGNPRIKGTPFDLGTYFPVFPQYDNSKPFFGTIGEFGFELTRNSSFFPIPYYISGNYRTQDGKTIIEYKVDYAKFGFYWLNVIMPILCLMFNFLIIKTGGMPIIAIIGFNLCLIIGFIISRSSIRNRKAELIKSLKSILQAE